MPNSVVVGLWTYSENSAGWSVQQRYQHFCGILRMFSNYVRAQQAILQTDNPCQGIFVAPEYYFSGPGKQPLTEADKMRVQQYLLQHSTLYPNIAIIPGSIYQRRSINGNEAVRNQWLTDIGRAAKDGVELEQAIHGRHAGYRSNVALTDNKLVGHAPDGRYVPALDKLAEAIYSGKNPVRVYNNTYILLNGRCYLRYEKTADFIEARNRAPANQIFIPGYRAGNASIPGSGFNINFGMEICFDHCNGILRRRNIAGIDFHIVVSDFVGTAPGNFACKPGGYFLHASTNYNESSVYYRDATGGVQNLTSSPQHWIYHTMTGPQSWLDVYRLVTPQDGNAGPVAPISFS